MKTLAAAVFCALCANAFIAATPVRAEDTMKKDGMANSAMEKDGMKHEDAMSGSSRKADMKKPAKKAAAGAMMDKKHGEMAKDAMGKDAMAKEPMAKDPMAKDGMTDNMKK
jgi:pentapeptide MXKDX repeat protein